MNRLRTSIAAVVAALSLGAFLPSVSAAPSERGAATSGTEGAADRPHFRTAAPVSGSCNINTADATQLSLLPGVGTVRAHAIIAHRQKAPFRTVEEIVKVKGIG